MVKLRSRRSRFAVASARRPPKPELQLLAENEMSTGLTYTVPAATTEVYVWTAAQPGMGTYSLEVRIQ